ncbi:MAG TPA: nuclear transport factor 2 family protein [Armatimonadota bacterium]|nr:nuclear transport factor 2 family protein [Armatimonadota bacterium]
MHRPLRNSLALALLLALPAAAAAPEQAVIQAHRALIAALNREDYNAARAIYAPDYVGQTGTSRHNLQAQLASLQALHRSGAKVKIDALLRNVKVTGNTATAVEFAQVNLTLPSGQVEHSRQRSEQRWKKMGSAWRLAAEKALTTRATPPARK